MICISNTFPTFPLPLYSKINSVKYIPKIPVFTIKPISIKMELGLKPKPIKLQPSIVATGIPVHFIRSMLLLFNGFLLFLLLPFRNSPLEKIKAKGEVSDVATRRELAIRKLREDADKNTSFRDFELFVTERGDTLFTQSWIPKGVDMRGLVVLMHGLNEHSGRYDYFAKQLNASGFKVYAMDWIGHGGSDGLHGYVHSLDYAVNDLKAFLDRVLTANPGLPCFSFGHSTGAAILLKAVLDPKLEACINGIVLTSPAICVQASHPIVEVVAPLLSFLLPKAQFDLANKRGPPVSRDPEAVKAKYSDPLVFTGAIRARTGYEILQISSFLQKNLHKIKIPFLVLHGTSDTITDPLGSQKLYLESPSKDKSIKLYHGYLHDLLFEPEKDEVAKDIIDWLTCRIQVNK